MQTSIYLGILTLLLAYLSFEVKRPYFAWLLIGLFLLVAVVWAFSLFE